MTVSKVKGQNLRATCNSSVISQNVMAEIRHAGVEQAAGYRGRLV